MKKSRLFLINCLLVLTAAPTWATVAAESTKHPVIHAVQPVHAFEKVLDGKKVIHDFIIENNGDATLEIQKVDTT